MLTADDLKAYLRDRIASFKVPVYMRVQYEPVIATASGKQLKRKLREEVAKEREEKEGGKGKL